MENKHVESKYRWYVLSLSALTLTFCVAMPRICMAVLFNEISADIGLNIVEVGWIWGFFPLSGILTVFVAGLLSDRFGAKRMLIIACIMGGLAGASRGVSSNFISLAVTTMLYGLFHGVLPATILKMIATWFSSRQLGLAIGTLATGMGLGFTISSMFSATLLSPMLGGWRGVLFLYGAISVLISLIWFITVKEPMTVRTGTGDRFTTLETIYHVLHNKHVWLISIGMLGYTACIEGMNGYLPLYLREFKGWLPASADGTLAAFMGFSTLGAVPISLLSDKIGLRKLFLLSIVTAAIVGVGLLSVADGLLIWVLMILVGVGRDGLIALSNATNIEDKGIGAQYAGTAGGFMQTFTRIGSFISPPMGNSLAASGAGLPFIVWSAFGAIALVCFLLTRETGHRQA
ncbi:MAG: MFS transporter [Deltaproteobacteria bacterium]|nr:MFS transporter [Deltaproteobacteria bacterium]